MSHSSSLSLLAACIIITLLPVLVLLIFIWVQLSVILGDWVRNRRRQRGARDDTGATLSRIGTLDSVLGIVNVPEPDIEAAQKEKD